jgi:hypothetical protein
MHVCSIRRFFRIILAGINLKTSLTVVLRFGEVAAFIRHPEIAFVRPL